MKFLEIALEIEREMSSDLIPLTHLISFKEQGQ